MAAAEDAARIAAKLTQARKDEGEAIKALAGLSGTDTQVKAAAAQAATGLAAAVRDEAAAKQTVVDVMVAQRAATEAQALAEGKLDEERKKALATMDEKIAKAAAEAEASRKAAEASEVQAAAARLAADSMADNTARYGEFQRAVDAARLAVESVRTEMRYGRATSDDLRLATIRLAEAQGRLKDSIEDTAKASQAYISQKRAEIDTTNAGLRLKLEEAKTLERFATLHGLETQALQAKIKQKEIELEIARNNAQAKRIEADETIRATEQLKAELALASSLTPEKEQELNLRIQNARAKQLEASAGLEAARAIESEIAALKRLGPAKRDAASAPTPTATGTVNAPAGNLGPAPMEVTPSTSTPVAFDNSYVFQLRERLRRGDTFSADEAPAIRNALEAAKVNARLAYGSSVPSLTGIADANGWVVTLERIMGQLNGAALGPGVGFGSRGLPAGGDAGGNTAGIPVEAVPVKVPSSTSRTVNINIAGLGAAAVNVASDADAAKLEALLRSLGNAANRSAA